MSSADEQVSRFLNTAPNPVLFTGAGASMRAGLPNWPKLLTELANQIRANDPMTAAHIDQSVRDGELLFAATLFTESPKVTPVNKRQVLQRVLTAQSVENLRPLTRLPISSVFTTNFDRTLFEVWALAKQSAPIDYHYGSSSFVSSITESNFHITRLHGRIEGGEPIVFSKSEYEKALQDVAYLDVIRYLFTQRQLLIVGFSFIDPAFQTVLDAIDRVYGSRSIGEHLALIPTDADDSFLSKLLRLS